ncbi:GntR family transcriptional regulator [Streptomyces radicis]|uniref:GntR family transcriptional regulator n=1 Tax=Streptomyces radicis TaxID=1750517 RepID=A0A3A9W1W2_9ACTN|nr:GntR family transcriptional regulator [Streptomyces radicis]RKN03184.1 GntR family transcriptional regulator [Streptomyces radicis]RKN13091.1 GntR family transcriptional regulator [Streptomyces radicis]
MGTTQLDHQPEPKYRHLKTVLSRALDTEFSVGQALPNERELAARFGVARATLRQALDQLELEGRLQRRRGVGTTVAPPRVGVDVSPRQHTWPGAPGDTWVASDAVRTTPPPAVARALDVPAEEPVEVVHRTLIAHGQPVAAEQLHIPVDVLPPGDEPRGTSGAERARAVLARLGRLDLGGQDRSVELGSAGSDDARRLDRLPGSAVLIVTTRYVAGGRTVAVAVATYRADTCRLTFGNQASGSQAPLSLSAS